MKRLLVSWGLIAALLFLSIGAAGAALVSKKADSQKSLLQFVAGNHILGFDSRGVYTAGGTHALRVDFVRAQQVEPQTDSGEAFRRVVYAGLWEGISLEYASLADGLYMTTYALAPGANAKHIRLRYNAPVILNQNGTLTIAFENGSFTESAPIAWQVINGQRVPVEVSFRLSALRNQKSEIGFALGAYDPQYGVTIDPSLVWNTFLGSASLDWGYGLARDGGGNLYVTGYSAATWGSPVRAFTAGGNDCFVAKLDPSGNLLWNTFLGGSGSDECRDIVYNGSEILVVGNSNAAWSGPTVRAYSSKYDTMVAKLNASSGALIWNSFLGGTEYDYGRGVSFANPGGYVYVAGYSNANWGTSPKRTYTSGYDGYAAKLDSSGALVWHAFLGGSGSDYGRDIYALSAYAIYTVGYSNADWGASTIDYTAGDDAYIVLLDYNGLMSWLSFLGGSGDDYGIAITVPSAGAEYVLGGSSSTWGSPVRAFSGPTEDDAFIARVGASGTLTWNTFLGSDASDVGYDITTDSSGNVYATGSSDDEWGSPLRAHSGSSDAYVAKVTSAGALSSNTFIGSSAYESGHGLAVDSSGDVYVAGPSAANWGSPKRAYSADDVFAAKVDLQRPTVSSISYLDSDPTDKSAVEYLVIFSEPVTDVMISDFGIYPTGLSGASITAVSCGGHLCTVYVNTGTGDGTFHIKVLGWADIYDLGGNLITGVPYSSPVYTVDKTMVFRSQGANDGWVLESTETSNVGGSLNSADTTFRLGDDASDKQYRSILSFNTASLPDTAVITKVMLKIKKQGLTGTDPFTILSSLRVDIKNPYFGSGLGLANHDFHGAASANNIGAIPNAPVSGWYTKTWTSGSFFSFLNRTGTTQFRLRFNLDDNNDNGADYMRFYSGDAGAASRPQLIIEYYVP